MDDITGGIVTKSADWLITQGVLGIAVVLLIVVVIVQRREINSVRTAADAKIENRDQIIRDLQTARLNDIKLAIEPIHGLGKTIEAWLEMRRR